MNIISTNLVLTVVICLLIRVSGLVFNRSTTRLPFSDFDNQELDDIIIDPIQLANRDSLGRFRRVVLGEGTSNTNLEAALSIALSVVRGEEQDRHSTRRQSQEQRAAMNIVNALQESSSSEDDILSSGSSESENLLLDPTYCPPLPLSRYKRPVTLATMRKIIQLVESGRSEEKVRKMYPWYRKGMLKDFRRCVVEGNSRMTAMQTVNKNVWERFERERIAGHPIRGYHIRDWAMHEAIRLGAERHFKASTKWLHNFKRKYGISSRKITKISSRAERDHADGDARASAKFQEEYGFLSMFIRRNTIWNVDQTGFNYEQTTLRTLSHRGERDTVCAAESRNKRTHSYTSQPMISRDGRLIGKLLLCFQEARGVFGPRVAAGIRDLENIYGNIRAFASASGKMTSNLMADWAREILIPAFDEHFGSIGNESETQAQEVDNILRYFKGDRRGFDKEDENCYNEAESRELGRCSWYDSSCRQQAWARAGEQCVTEPKLLLIADSWAGNNAIAPIARPKGIKVLTVPERCTGTLQPLDVGFMRQYKLFINRITDRALQEGLLDQITTREGILNMHSLVWNQFNSPHYEDMLRHTWHGLDLDFNDAEMQVSPPRRVIEIQFPVNMPLCSHTGCQNRGFIRCSHCGKFLCLEHFLNRTCFHHREEEYETEIYFEDYRDEQFTDETMDLDEEELVMNDDEAVRRH